MVRGRKIHQGILVTLLALGFGFGCSPGEDSFISKDQESTLSHSGSIILSNINSKNVVMLSAGGTWVKDLLALDRSGTDIPYGVSLFNGDQLIVAVDGVDRITRIHLDGVTPNSELVMNSNLTGNLRGITQLASGDILIVETSNVERFLATGERVASGGWPRALQTVGTGVAAFADSGFVHCSTTTDVVRVYDDAGVQTATASPGIAATTDVVDCAVGPSGEVAAVFNGTTDTIRVYSSKTLSTITYSYSNLSLLANPRVAAFRSNGNLLIADGTTNLIVELDPTGVLVGTIASSAVNNPSSMVVLP